MHKICNEDIRNETKDIRNENAQELSRQEYSTSEKGDYRCSVKICARKSDFIKREISKQEFSSEFLEEVHDSFSTKCF